MREPSGRKRKVLPELTSSVLPSRAAKCEVLLKPCVA
jgi:hypothetical protein